MDVVERGVDSRSALEEVLGYLNFSSGAPDAKFLRNLNELFRSIESEPAGRDAPVAMLQSWLAAALDQLCQQGGAFADAGQARSVLALLFDSLLPAYRRFHADLLQHQSDADLWRPFFLGRALEALLAEGPPQDNSEHLVATAIAALNDYVGYRPVAVVESDQKIEPYENERARPCEHARHN